jgi:plasmid stabilization system protein ParE
MKFRLKSVRRAERAYHQIVDYIAARSKPGAAAWTAEFDQTVRRISRAADTFPPAQEADSVDFELREALFKTRRGLTYRILFTIRDDEVIVLHLRGPGQGPVAPEELQP